MTAPVYLVRLGGARGAGRYVSRWALLGVGGFIRDGRTTARQRYAKRSAQQRRRTPVAFAEWLLDIAGSVPKVRAA